LKEELEEVVSAISAPYARRICLVYENH
jgi:hypothetical protein